MEHTLLSPADPVRSILVPLDGSRLAELALAPAIELATTLHAKVILFHVLETAPPAEIHGEAHLNHRDEAVAYLDSLRNQVAVPGLQIESHVHEDPEKDVSRSIVDHADELNIDLVVLANHGSGGIRGFLFGRVAQQVVQRGHKPVLVIPAERQSEDGVGGARKLSLFLNRSAEAEAAIPITLRLAIDLPAPLHLILVVPTTGTLAADRSISATLMPRTARELLNIEEQDAQEYLEQLASRISGSGVTVTFTVIRGDPARTSVEEAERVGAGIAVMTTHARGGLSGIWSGSVGSKILARTSLPLLLVPAPE